jgi:hypothetical protein
MLIWSNILAFSDSLGVQLDRLKTALGTGSQGGSVSKAAKTNLARIQTAVAPTGGNDAQVGADMLDKSIAHLANVTSGSAKCYELLRGDYDNLKDHIRQRGGTNNTFDLQADVNGGTDRYSPSFAELARGLSGTLLAVNVYPPVTSLGTYAVSGAGAGVYTDGSAIDTTLYGGADIEAEATTAATNIAITAVGIDVDGAETNCTGTLNGVLGTKVNLTAANGKKIVNIKPASVTITGGAAAEAFKIQSKVDRTPAE